MKSQGAAKYRMKTLEAVHVVNLTANMEDEGCTRVRLDQLTSPPDETTHPRMVHPVVRRHPRTGERLLFVNELMTSHIEAIGNDESEELIQRAYQLLYAPRNTYVHEWRVNDLIIWDNIALQHARARPITGSRRKLRRVTVGPFSGYTRLRT